ncbi:hypothetical protein EP7_003467 [Isosphaeraceae bacterium EP7]
MIIQTIDSVMATEVIANTTWSVVCFRNVSSVAGMCVVRESGPDPPRADGAARVDPLLPGY